jgi:hypothetical protein
VEFTAGFSADWADLPADLKQAMLILAARLGQDMDPEKGIPFAVSVLLEPYRALRLRGGRPMTRPNLTRKLVVEAPDRIPMGRRLCRDLGRPRRGLGRGDDTGCRPRDRHRLAPAAEDHGARAPQGAASRPTAAMRFRDGVRVYDIEAVTEADASGRYLTCFATEEVGA